jgi:hypothetical protein
MIRRIDASETYIDMNIVNYHLTIESLKVTNNDNDKVSGSSWIQVISSVLNNLNFRMKKISPPIGVGME